MRHFIKDITVCQSTCYEYPECKGLHCNLKCLSCGLTKRYCSKLDAVCDISLKTSLFAKVPVTSIQNVKGYIVT